MSSSSVSSRIFFYLSLMILSGGAWSDHLHLRTRLAEAHTFDCDPNELTGEGTVGALGSVQDSVTHSVKDPETIKSAQHNILRGQDRIKEGRFQEAIVYFQRSQCQVSDLQNLIMIGALYAKVRDCSAAYLAWSQAVDECGSCSKRQKIINKIIKYTQQCTRKVQIITPHVRANIYINQQHMGMTPYETPILLGGEIKLTAPGYQDHLEILDAQTQSPLVRSLKSVSRFKAVARDQPRAVLPRQPKIIPSQSNLRVEPRLNLTPPMDAVTYQWSGDEVSPPISDLPKNTKLKTGLFIASGVLAITSLGLYGYSASEYEDLMVAKRNSIQNLTLFKRAEDAKALYITSGVLIGFAVTSTIIALVLDP